MGEPIDNNTVEEINYSEATRGPNIRENTDNRVTRNTKNLAGDDQYTADSRGIESNVAHDILEEVIKVGESIDNTDEAINTNNTKKITTRLHKVGTA